ncbi:MAG: PPC domain-containing protein [Aphanizomenon gracile PMC644.10]|nr:PPC domain-containing protein [Aphanizomenon gracile PMC644.10]
MPKQAGNSITTALDIGTVDTSIKVFEDIISNADSIGYYKFAIAENSKLDIKLSGLSQNVDLFLLNADGSQVVAQYAVGGNIDENIIQNLRAGSYYFYASGGGTGTIKSLSTDTFALLSHFASGNTFWDVLDTSFGTGYDGNIAENLRYQWQTGDFSQLPTIEVISSDVWGSAKGAYAISTNTIYLSSQFVTTASQQSLLAVILEEIGHCVDAHINKVDSAGDEGAIFAALVQGESLDVRTLQALRNEDDRAIINLNEQPIQVECSTFIYGNYGTFYGGGLIRLLVMRLLGVG